MVSRERPSWASRQALYLARHCGGLLCVLLCPSTLWRSPSSRAPPDRPAGLAESRYLHIAVEAEGRHEDPVHVAEGRGALLLPVDEEGQSVLVQVQQHAHGGPLAHATFRPRKETPRMAITTPSLDVGDGSRKSLKGCWEYPHLQNTAPSVFFWACDPCLQVYSPVTGHAGRPYPLVRLLTLQKPGDSAPSLLTVSETWTQGVRVLTSRSHLEAWGGSVGGRAPSPARGRTGQVRMWTSRTRPLGRAPPASTRLPGDIPGLS